MKPSPRKARSWLRSRQKHEPDSETLRQWVDQRHPKTVQPNPWMRSWRRIFQTEEETESFDTPRTFFEWVEEIGTIVLILGACFVWIRLILAAFGVCPLF